MKYEEIEKFMKEKMKAADATVKISFKTRSAINGLFIKTQDFNELSRKNLWRIVSESHISSYKQSHDEKLAKIFNGTEFTRLEVVT